MSILLQITMLTAAAGILLALVSGGFADGLSRAFEGALDAVEYRLALRARGRAGREGGREQRGTYAEALRVNG